MRSLENIKTDLKKSDTPQTAKEYPLPVAHQDVIDLVRNVEGLQVSGLDYALNAITEIAELKKTQCCKENCPHAGFWEE